MNTYGWIERGRLLEEMLTEPWKMADGNPKFFRAKMKHVNLHCMSFKYGRNLQLVR